MSGNLLNKPVDGAVLLLLALVNGVVLEAGLVQGSRWYVLLYLTVPLFLLLLVQRLWAQHAERRRRRQRELLHCFCQQATSQGLSFSSQEQLQNGMLGLDARRGSLLAVQRTATGRFQGRVVPLRAIDSCSVPEAQVLRLHLRHEQRPIDLVFADGNKGSYAQAGQKAWRWARLLGQLLRRPPRS